MMASTMPVEFTDLPTKEDQERASRPIQVAIAKVYGVFRTAPVWRRIQELRAMEEATRRMFDAYR
jgi:hypothetical protein